jgi:Icc-related predicted phosphoesterase
MEITCIADLHGNYPKLYGGDLLIVAGDLTAGDKLHQYVEFAEWLDKQPYDHSILIGGNHDNMLLTRELSKYGMLNGNDHHTYLCDSGTEFEGLKIWGSPWTLTFPGINPLCTAFTGAEEELEAKFAIIPPDIDILITHGPPKGMLDRTVRGDNAGSMALSRCYDKIKPKLHVFGHIHEDYGQGVVMGGKIKTLFVNCSHVNERYEPINNPARFTL